LYKYNQCLRSLGLIIIKPSARAEIRFLNDTVSETAGLLHRIFSMWRKQPNGANKYCGL